MNWQLVAFAFLTGATLYSAYRVATDRNVTHAALYLAVAFLGVAGYFLLLGAEFLAAVQVLVYEGAVMTVMVFAIMLSEMREVRGEQASLPRLLVSRYWGPLPLLIGLGLFAAFLLVQRDPALAGRSPAPANASLFELAGALLSTYLIPFEVVSVLLLAAMIGAIVITRREGGEG